MSGPLSISPHRTKGSWIPRLTGAGAVVVLAAGGLTAYLSTHHQATVHSRHPVLSSKVLSAQTVGLIDFGPDDDGNRFQNDRDDHPLMLKPTRAGLYFVTISAAQRHDGTPLWTANQMADGTEIFIYVPTGQCLTAVSGSGSVQLAHCDLQASQRWRAVNAMTELGQPFAAYSSELTGNCLTAPPAPSGHEPANPGPAKMAPCGQPRDKSQEIAFWWSA
jgi:hypothetical protein